MLMHVNEGLAEAYNLPSELELDGRICGLFFMHNVHHGIDRKSLSYRHGYDSIGSGTVITNLEGGYVEFSGIGVNVKHRQRGVGRIIVSLLEGIARNEGARQVRVDSLPTAVGFYEKVGFKDLGVTPKGTLAAVGCHRMVKQIEQP